MNVKIGGIPALFYVTQSSIQHVQLLCTVTLLFFLRYLLSTTTLVASKVCLFLLKSDKQTDVVCHD